ncbi:phosphatase PAP2 family protein [Streptomyces somaliensis DSM 40738]|uniref:Phosphatase PAP2 family protein n=1 Tax=Streptomyces somaliensis (strain ATCC 33201 / DSM 40738 / JCM 12659 / KCTC 9044 / NCTC 11332 / NRRL B-12077 / IP 733) TaxID=1134445 RepID=A0AA44DGS2_STRE0|nr:phosphatase PAP2 family protein [Streptomyces somaliensis]MCQ0023463.1 phosphatase PAP2 family protein [Streptomyces somaliensis DSM 40738]NKY15836.1 phosphatase PAP2 family protein [Streptomyces somaliensis DSM 40738]
MREGLRSQGTAGGSGSGLPQFRSGRATAHIAGTPRTGDPHRSDRRPPHTPRGERHTGPDGRPGTTPPVPGRPAFVVALLSLCGFLLVTWQVAVDGPLAALDERAGRALTGRGPERLAELGADLGGLPVALPVLAAAMAHAVRRGRRRAALCAGAAMALVPALVVPLKLLLDRPGPLTGATGHYPSGHTATAVVAYGAAALLVHRRALVPVAAVLTAATGAGLVLRGYHWPLDVVGGVLLFGAGFAALAGLTALRERRDRAGPAGR